MQSWEHMCYGENSKRCLQAAKQRQENSFEEKTKQPQTNPSCLSKLFLAFKSVLKWNFVTFTERGKKPLIY